MGRSKSVQVQTPSVTDLGYIAEQLRPLAVPIDQLTSDPANTRKHNIANISGIKGSLRVYGQRKPIVVNRRNGVVEAGNGTLEAAVALNWTHLAVVYVDDDPNTAAGYSVSDNRTAELAEWDNEALSKILLEIKTEDEDLQAMLQKFADDEGIKAPDDRELGDPDEVPEPPVDPITKPGDLWLLGVYYECDTCGKRYEYAEGQAMKERCPCG